MKPDHFRDIIATNALYRPGPLEGGMVDDYIQVKHGRKQAEYKHPVMEEILEETHGVMVYQEQVMRILQPPGRDRAGQRLHVHQGDQQEEAVGDRQVPRSSSCEGAQDRGLSEKEADEVFGLIENFAGYGFNKSHSTAYALIAYMTAYLKAHWPLEFMAALLSSDMPSRNFKRKDSLVEHLEDCKRMGIEVVSPDVNRCGRRFRRSPTARSSSAWRRSRAAAPPRPRRSARPARPAGPSAASSTSASGSIPARSTAPPSNPSSRPGPATRWAAGGASCST